MSKPTAVAILVIALSSSLAAAPTDSVIHHNRLASPEIGSESTVSSGEPLFSSSEETVTEWARLKADALVSKSGMILPKGLLLECSIEHGSDLKECCKGFSAALYCLKDLDHDGRFDKVQIVVGGRPVEHLNAPYEIVLQPDPEQPRWKRELIFQGAAAGILHLTYRQYSSDWSHPDVSNDLVYEIAPSGSTEVAYRGVHVVFESITGNSVRYKLASGFAKD
jgi:hypothetical protein